MTDIMAGLGLLIIVFFLVMLLGLQIQITGINRKVDEIIQELKKSS